ncbi:MAG: ExeA family protein [Planctomycetota bacterium]|jgi:general secretion pathway protein A
MYEEYWGLSEKPFMNTPDSRYLFFSKQHEEVLTRMLYTITEDKGAMLFTGDYGCGKTLMSRTLLEQLDPERYDIAILPHPNLQPMELLHEILYQFGYEAPKDANKTDLLHLLNDCLLSNKAKGRSTIIMVDEAQMVTDPLTLEEIRLLLNFQQEKNFLLTLILIGQPELKETLEELPQLLQRLSVKYHLCSLTQDDSRTYIRHRLEVAGTRHELFTSRAEEILIDASDGIPRILNNMADMSLMVGFGQRSPIIDDGIVSKVVKDIGA